MGARQSRLSSTVGPEVIDPVSQTTPGRQAHNEGNHSIGGEEPSARELKREIDDTRDHMDFLLDELAEVLHPRQWPIYAKRWWQARRAHAAAQVSTEQPSRREALQERLQGNLEHGKEVIQEQLNQGREKVQESWEEGKEQLQRRWHQGRSSIRGAIREKGSNLRRHSQEAWGHTKTRLEHTGEQIRSSSSQSLHALQERSRSTLADQPLMVAVTMASLGFAVGWLLPASRRERQWLGQSAAELKAQAGHMAKAAVEGGLQGVSAQVQQPSASHQAAS